MFFFQPAGQSWSKGRPVKCRHLTGSAFLQADEGRRQEGQINLLCHKSEIIHFMCANRSLAAAFTLPRLVARPHFPRAAPSAHLLKMLNTINRPTAVVSASKQQQCDRPLSVVNKMAPATQKEAPPLYRLPPRLQKAKHRSPGSRLLTAWGLMGWHHRRHTHAHTGSRMPLRWITALGITISSAAPPFPRNPVGLTWWPSAESAGPPATPFLSIFSSSSSPHCGTKPHSQRACENTRILSLQCLHSILNHQKPGCQQQHELKQKNGDFSLDNQQLFSVDKNIPTYVSKAGVCSFTVGSETVILRCAYKEKN